LHYILIIHYITLHYILIINDIALQLSKFLAGDYRLGVNFLPKDEAKIKAPSSVPEDGIIYS
jgi:hypothetical protein